MTQDVLQMSYMLEGEKQQGRFVRGGMGGLLIEGPSGEVDSLISIELTGGVLCEKKIEMLGRIKRMGATGKTDLFPVKLLRMTSRDGVVPMKGFLREHLDTDLSSIDPDQVIRIGNYWAVICSPEDPDSVFERHPRIERQELKEFFKVDDSAKTLHIYIRRTICYLINRVPYFGRAVRMNHQELIVHTNMVLPTLGSPVHIQFSIENEEGPEHLAVVVGTVKRRSDQKEEAGWKGRFEVAIRYVEEVETAGTFFPFLEAIHRDQQDEEQDAS